MCTENIRHMKLKQTGMKTSPIWFSFQNTITFLSLCEQFKTPCNKVPPTSLLLGCQ